MEQVVTTEIELKTRRSASGRVAQTIRERIVSGEYSAGSRFPSRRALAEQYQVAPATIEQAVKILISDGLLFAEHGRGTFVAGEQATSKSRPGDVMPPRAAPRSASAFTVGIVSSSPLSVDIAWNNAVIRAMEHSISTAGGSVRYAPEPVDCWTVSTLLSCIDSLIADGADGIILVAVRGPQDLANAIHGVRQSRIPSVYVCVRDERVPLVNVYYDFRDAGYVAASHLVERGANSVAYFVPYAARAYWSEARMAGVQEAIKFAARPVDLRLCLEAPPVESCDDSGFGDRFHESGAYEFARCLLQDGLPADGVVAANDAVAYGFMRAARESGFVAGRDYMIVGFDDEPQSRGLGLTTLRPPLERMGREAVALLSREISEPGHTMRTCLKSEFVARASTMAFTRRH
ncbi:MAG: GntR family transcriptional regulator [Capsulimonadaceae bacterium]|nr:GntR family transcriptional regulator [Capsulimonadaceae bacterium]